MGILQISSKLQKCVKGSCIPTFGTPFYKSFRCLRKYLLRLFSKVSKTIKTPNKIKIRKQAPEQAAQEKRGISNIIKLSNISKTSRYINIRINFSLLLFISFNLFSIFVNKVRNLLLNHKIFLTIYDFPSQSRN